jgi:hypothetical protein
MSKTQTLPRSWEFKFNAGLGNWCLVDDTDSIRHLSGPPCMAKTPDMLAIEALPDLLAALRESAGEFARLAGMLQDGNPLFGKILRDAATAAYSAIAKAEGGAA